MTYSTYWRVCFEDPTDLGPFIARLKADFSDPGLPANPVHPVGTQSFGEVFAVSPALTEPLRERWGDDETIEYYLGVMAGAERPTYIETKKILPSRAMLDPADPGRPAAAWFDWGRESHPPAADGTSWYHRMLRLPEAWDALGGLGGNRPWQAVRLGHIDTGYTFHPAFGDWGAAGTDWVLLDDGGGVETGTQPIDPMEGSNAGHATSIGSVIAGDMRGEASAPFVGGAPGVTVLPYRIGDSVVIGNTGDTSRPARVAAAIRTAVSAGCGVVNMSLGGPAFTTLQPACEEAYRAGLIMVCAAGNVVGSVQYPGRFPTTICMAGVGPMGLPWQGSARGKPVDACAPASVIYRARTEFQYDNQISTFGSHGDGTSYATALTSATAALWLAKHGEDTLNQTYPEGWMRVEAFRALLHETAKQTHQNTYLLSAGIALQDLPPGFGAGIVDAAAIVAADLPDPDTLTPAISL